MAKQAAVGEYVTVLQRLVDILRKDAANPSNANFDQYIFRSISGLTYPVHRRHCVGLDRRFRVCPCPSVYRNPAEGH